MRKRIIVLLFCIIVFIVALPKNVVYAYDNNSLQSNPTIQSLLKNLDEQGNYLQIQLLKDYNEVERYYYLPFVTGGYLIYDEELDVVHEYSTTNGNSYIEGKSNLYYYGALGYIQKYQEEFYDIASGKNFGNLTHFKSFASQTDDKLIQNKNKVQTRTVSAQDAQSCISGVVPNFWYNPNGICGSTAAAMMLRWYDIYVDGDYVPSDLVDNDGVTLIKHLVPYIDGDIPGSDQLDMYNGIMNYCNDQGVSHSVSLDYATAINVVGRVDTYQRPFVLKLNGAPTYGNHWVTGYGYNISNGETYVIVNDGWGDRDISINLINCDYMVW